MKHFFQSVRWKLQLWHALLLLLVIVGLLFRFYALQYEQAFVQIDRQIQRWSHRVAESMRHIPPPHPWENKVEFWFRELELSPDLAPDFSPDGNVKAYCTIWDSRGSLVFFTDSTPKAVAYPSELTLASPYRTLDGSREYTNFLPSGTTILIGLPLEGPLNELKAQAWQLASMGLGIMAIGLAGGWWFISRAIRPIGAISRAADAISQGRLSERISVAPGTGELNQLTNKLNHTFERLENLFAQQVRFTADASHELRTPISVIRSKTQLALSRNRSPAEYREALAACERASERMGNIVESLLDLARIDSGEMEPASQTFELEPVLHEAVESVQPLATEAEIELTVSHAKETVYGVPVWTQQVITNLLVNAVRYSPNTERVEMKIERDADWVKLHVSDQGPGIPESDLTHIFERFFRIDKARSRKGGGSGLGLSICRALMEAQKGTIEAVSEVGKGSTFSITLPAASTA